MTRGKIYEERVQMTEILIFSQTVVKDGKQNLALSNYSAEI